MRKDIQKIRRTSKKIVTKHEWMMSALDMLEKQDKATHRGDDDNLMILDEETP